MAVHGRRKVMSDMNELFIDRDERLKDGIERVTFRVDFFPTRRVYKAYVNIWNSSSST